MTCDDKFVHITSDVINTGDFDAYDTPQIYVSHTNSSLYRPKKELKGFKKVFVKAKGS